MITLSDTQITNTVRKLKKKWFLTEEEIKELKMLSQERRNRSMKRKLH